jgi:hypothetical protein
MLLYSPREYETNENRISLSNHEALNSRGIVKEKAVQV